MCPQSPVVTKLYFWQAASRAAVQLVGTGAAARGARRLTVLTVDEELLL